MEIYRDPEGAGVVMTVKVSDTVAPDVIVADAGWWYPGEKDIHAATRSSVNRITDSGRRDPYMGSSTLRGVPVGLRPVATAEAKATADAEAEGGGGAHGAHSTH